MTESNIIADSSTSVISEKESLEFFNEGLKKAASCAMEMAAFQSHPIWRDIATLLNELRQKGMMMANSKAMSRQDVLLNLDRRQGIVGEKADAAANKGKFIIN